MNNNSRHFSLFIRRFKGSMPIATENIAYLAEQFFRASFKKQGVTDVGFKPWKPRKLVWPGKQRQLLYNTGKLFRSIGRSSTRNKAIVFSTAKYGPLHNEGGSITVTPAMRRFFWAMYYKNGGAKKSARKGASEKVMNRMQTSEMWKSLALTKKSKLHIPARPFIYHSKTLEKKIERYIDKHIKTLKV